MEPVELFVRNPVKVAVGVLLVALFGTIAFLRMPMQLTPEVQTPTISIETAWPGASPQEVEREIVQPQEEQLKSVEGLTKLSSESSDSRATVSLEFLVGTNMDSALLKVNARLQQVRDYPEDAQEPVISTSSSSGSPIAWYILGPLVPEREEVEAFAAAHPAAAESLAPVIRADSIGLRLSRLRRAAAENPAVEPLLPAVKDVPALRRFTEDVIEARFERVPGVSNSDVLGGRIDELQVIVDPAKLAARRVTIADVRNALRARNKDTIVHKDFMFNIVNVGCGAPRVPVERCACAACAGRWPKPAATGPCWGWIRARPRTWKSCGGSWLFKDRVRWIVGAFF